MAFGLILSRFTSMLDYQPDGKTTFFSPATPILCPQYSNQRCLDTDLQVNVMLIEGFASFVFIHSWQFIRSYPLNTKFQFLLKPFFIYFIYQASRLMSAETALGPLNPLLALEIWLWDYFVYT